VPVEITKPDSILTDSTGNMFTSVVKKGTTLNLNQNRGATPSHGSECVVRCAVLEQKKKRIQTDEVDRVAPSRKHRSDLASVSRGVVPETLLFVRTFF
jgi:hypothetical protein